MKLVTAFAAIATLALLVPATGSAADGTYTQVLCFNPDTGKGVGAPEEVRHLGGAPFSHLDVDCVGNADAESGLTLRSGLPVATNVGMAGEMEYTAPDNVALVSGQVYRIFRVTGGDQRVTLSQHAGASLDYFGQPRSELFQWWPNGLHDFGSSAAIWDTGNRVQLAVADGRWRYTGGCDSTSGCNIAAGSVFLRIFGGKLALRDAADPQLVGSVSGSVAESAVVSGIADVTFSASDLGSGLYRARILVDDQIVRTTMVDSNAGRCVDVEPQNSDDYEFASATPCKLNASVSTSVDTRAIPDGAHRVKVAVEDASGNETTVFNKAVVVSNHAVLPAGGFGQVVDQSRPTLAFFVSRKRLRNGQALRYFGSLSGTGNSRRFVDVQVRKSKTQWQVVCSVQTDPTGRYACRHRFKRTFRKTRYVFRARVRAQAGLSIATLTTSTRSVLVRP
jgi:hypothetical protein